MLCVYNLLSPIMVTRLFKNFIRYSRIQNISKANTMDQKKCYFRLVDNNKVDITFLYEIKEGTTRQFNFSRQPSEALENILSRISTNIEKVLKKANKKKGNVEQHSLDINFIDNDNCVLDNTQTCLELFSFKSPVKLKIIDKIYDAVFNPPWIVSVSLPQCILVGFPVYPEKIVSQNTEHSHNTFKWYKGLSVNEKNNQISESHIKWEFLKSGFVYTPATSDIGMKLKLECIPGNSSLTGPAVEIITSSLVEAGPGKCPFEARHMFTSKKLQLKSFRCVTYNILADLYCDSDFTRTELHPYCPPYALNIDYRKHLILKELMGYNSDIICLQEVDTKIFTSCLKPLLAAEGLEGLFFRKAKEVAEGLACFYRRDRFRLLTEHKIVFSDELKSNKCFKSIWAAIKENKPLLERLLNRSTVASATVLRSVDNPKNVIIVGNTHLYFHPDADHIRLIQGGMCIYWLKDILKKLEAKLGSTCTISIILCGDFNSVPSCGIYQLYTTGEAPSSLMDWKSNENEAVNDLSLKQDIPLSSACGTPEYTNFTAGFADCLDYIFYDKSNLEVEQVVPLPSNEELHAYTALPSIVFPSDHIALVADLRFKKH